MNEQNENNEQENLGGTTNLSLDQLKAEGGATTTTNNPDGLENTDDLYEIQAGDDLDEPGEDNELDETNAEGTEDDDDETLLDDDELIPNKDLDEENAANPENNS